MKEEKDILKQIDRRDGMTVPEGYFADFAARMADSLEPTAFETGANTMVLPRTFWQKVRPYVYMAAMFAGVWCMLKMFTLMSHSPQQQLQPSPVMAEALGNEVFVNEYILSSIDQWDLMDEMMEDGFTVTDLEAPADDLQIEEYEEL